MDTGLKGKRALVTGGGSGIGRAIALALAREGVHLAIASRDPDSKTIEEIRALGNRVLPLRADVSREDQVVAMVQQAIEGLGGLDLYVNNAAWAWHEPATKLTTENWLKTIHTNLSSCVWACREIAKYMIAQGKGSILIVGSTAMWTPSSKETSYRVSKTGLKAYMEVLAVELAPFGIRVNMLTPGLFPTRLTANLDESSGQIMRSQIPLRRVGRTEELGAAAVLLLSDSLSSYTTGSELVVDGGLKLRPIPLFTDDELREMNL